MMVLSGPSLPPKIKSNLLGSLTIRLNSINLHEFPHINMNESPFKFICRIRFWGADDCVDLVADDGGNHNVTLSDDGFKHGHERRCLGTTACAVEFPIVGTLQGIEGYFTDMRTLSIPLIERRLVKNGEYENVKDKHLGKGHVSILSVFRELLQKKIDKEMANRSAIGGNSVRDRTVSSTKQLSISSTQTECQNIGEMEFMFVLRLRNDWDKSNYTSEERRLEIASIVSNRTIENRCLTLNECMMDALTLNCNSRQGVGALSSENTAKDVLISGLDDNLDLSIATENDSILLNAMMGSDKIGALTRTVDTHSNSSNLIESCCVMDRNVIPSHVNNSSPKLDLQRKDYPSMLNMTEDHRHKMLGIQFSKFIIDDVSMNDLVIHVPDGCCMVEYMLQFQAPPLATTTPPNESGMETVIIYKEELKPNLQSRKDKKRTPSKKLIKMTIQQCHKVKHESLWNIRFVDDEGIKSWMEKTLVIDLIAKYTSLLGDGKGSEKYRLKGAKRSTSPSCEKSVVLAKASIELQEVLLKHDLKLAMILPFQRIENKMSHGSISVQLQLLPLQKCSNLISNSNPLKSTEEEVMHLISGVEEFDSFDLSDDTMISECGSPSLEILEQKHPKGFTGVGTSSTKIAVDASHHSENIKSSRHKSTELIIPRQDSDKTKVTTDIQRPFQKDKPGENRIEKRSISSPESSAHSLWMCVLIPNISCVATQDVTYPFVYLKISCDDVGEPFVSPHVYCSRESSNEWYTTDCFMWFTPLGNQKSSKRDPATAIDRFSTIRIEVWNTDSSDHHKNKITNESRNSKQESCHSFLGVSFIQIDLACKDFDENWGSFLACDDNIYTQDKCSKRHMRIVVSVGLQDQVRLFMKRAKYAQVIQTWSIKHHRLRTIKETGKGIEDKKEILHESEKMLWITRCVKRKLNSVSDTQENHASKIASKVGRNSQGIDNTCFTASQNKLYIKFGKCSGIREMVALQCDKDPSSRVDEDLSSRYDDLHSSSGIMITFSLTMVNEDDGKPKLLYFSSAITRMAIINRHVTRLNYEFDIPTVNANYSSLVEHGKPLECSLWFIATVTDIMCAKFPAKGTGEVVPPSAKRMGTASCPLDVFITKNDRVSYSCPWIIKFSPSCEDSELIGHVQIIIGRKRTNLNHTATIKVECAKPMRGPIPIISTAEKSFNWALPDKVEALLSRRERMKGENVSKTSNAENASPNDKELFATEDLGIKRVQVDRSQSVESVYTPICVNLLEAKNKTDNAYQVIDTKKTVASIRQLSKNDLVSNDVKSIITVLTDKEVPSDHGGRHIQPSKYSSCEEKIRDHIGASAIPREVGNALSSIETKSQKSPLLATRRQKESTRGTASMKQVLGLRQSNEFRPEAENIKKFPKAEPKKMFPRPGIKKHATYLYESKTCTHHSVSDSSIGVEKRKVANKSDVEDKVAPNCDDDSSFSSLASLKMSSTRREALSNSPCSNSSSSSSSFSNLQRQSAIPLSTISCDDSFNTSSSGASSFSMRLIEFDKRNPIDPYPMNDVYSSSSSSISASSLRG